MTKKKLTKKLVVTTNQEGLNQPDLLQDSKNKVKAQYDFPLITPNLDPDKTVADALVIGWQTKFNTRDSLYAQVREITGEIAEDERKIKDIFVGWTSQIQKTTGITEEKIKQIFFGIKGVYDGHSESPISGTNSHVVILNVFNSGSLLHTIELINNVSKKTTLPFDVDHIDLYETFIQANTTDLKKMNYLGVVKRGRFINHFSPDEKDKDVWYVAVYVIKSNVEGGSELSPIVQAKVVK